MQSLKYITIWIALVALDVLVLSLGPLAKIRQLNEHKVIVAGQVDGQFNSVIHTRVPYTYEYKGVRYTGRGRSFAPNLPAYGLATGQPVEVTLNTNNPGESVLGDSRVALVAIRHLIVITALFFPLVGVFAVFLWDSRNKKSSEPGQDFTESNSLFTTPAQ